MELLQLLILVSVVNNNMMLLEQLTLSRHAELTVPFNILNHRHLLHRTLRWLQFQDTCNRLLCFFLCIPVSLCTVMFKITYYSSKTSNSIRSVFKLHRMWILCTRETLEYCTWLERISVYVHWAYCTYSMPQNALHLFKMFSGRLRGIQF